MIPTSRQFQPKDEWGGPISEGKLKATQDAANRRAADKVAADKGTAFFAKVDAYKNSPVGQAESNKRESERIANLRSNSVEGQSGSGGYSRSVGSNPIRREE